MNLLQCRCETLKPRVSFVTLFILYSHTSDGYLVKDFWRNLLTDVCSLDLSRVIECTLWQLPDTVSDVAAEGH
jgi:hypothetical protein